MVIKVLLTGTLGEKGKAHQGYQPVEDANVLVTPAKAGVQNPAKNLDSRFRGNDDSWPRRASSTGYHACLKNQRGQALVEAAMVVGILAILSMGVVEFGRAFMVSNMIINAARDGARSASVVPSTSRDPDSGVITDGGAIGQIENQVLAEIGDVLDPASLSLLSVVLNADAYVAGIPAVQITVSGEVPYIFDLPFVGTSFPVTRTVSFRDEGRSS